MRCFRLSLVVSSALAVGSVLGSAGCKQGVFGEDGTSSATDPTAATTPGADGGGPGSTSGPPDGATPSTSTDGGTTDASPSAACACASGQGCNPAGACVACTKSCGTNGTCVVGWEGGAHCQCAAGFYETLSGCAPVKGSPCDGVACGAHGTCFAGPPLGSPECRCDGDSIPYGLACAPMHALRCIDTDGTLKDKGSIRCNAADTAFEVCRDGNGDGTVEWVASGAPSCDAGTTCSACLDTKCNNGDGSGGQACPTGTVCMGMVHETPVYRCQPSCDCSNCGTCDPAQFTGYQRACGSTVDGASTPTKACASPCPHASDGCLPYGASAFCFPNEGCFSAAPKP